jgi:hypothetical protein
MSAEKFFCAMEAIKSSRRKGDSQYPILRCAAERPLPDARLTRSGFTPTVPTAAWSYGLAPHLLAHHHACSDLTAFHHPRQSSVRGDAERRDMFVFMG